MNILTLTKISTLTILILGQIGCMPTDNNRTQETKEPPSQNPQPGFGLNTGKERIIFNDGFEKSTTFIDLFQKDYSRFTHFEKTHKNNSVRITSNHALTGKHCLALKAQKSTSRVSKAALEKEGFDFRPGQKVKLSADIFIKEGSNLKDVFLFDLECMSCWPKNKKGNQHMGIRLMLLDAPGYIAVERGKIGYRKGTWYQEQPWRGFPQNKWVRLDWILKLSPNADGLTEVYIDNSRILSAKGINMPNADYLYKKHKLQLNLPVKYDKFEFGITANGSKKPIEMLVDNVCVSILD